MQDPCENFQAVHDVWTGPREMYARIYHINFADLSRGATMIGTLVRATVAAVGIVIKSAKAFRRLMA
jgi:hypothetical protein